MDDLGVSPNWDFMPPWVQNLLQTAAGTAMMVGLVVLVIALIIAGVGLAFARSQACTAWARTPRCNCSRPWAAPSLSPERRRW
ncbi:MAG: hypothetical protein ACRDT6_07135 [Micromonosporaceae bacterium]